MRCNPTGRTVYEVPLAESWVEDLFCSLGFVVDLPNIRLSVSAGDACASKLTKRVTEGRRSSVDARLVEPLYAADQQVAPAGARMLGRISRLLSLSQSRRLATGGDFRHWVGGLVAADRHDAVQVHAEAAA